MEMIPAVHYIDIYGHIIFSMYTSNYLQNYLFNIHPISFVWYNGTLNILLSGSPLTRENNYEKFKKEAGSN